jgi:hypothetical protein
MPSNKDMYHSFIPKPYKDRKYEMENCWFQENILSCQFLQLLMQQLQHWLNQYIINLLTPYKLQQKIYEVTNHKLEQKPTSVSVVLDPFQATEFSATCSANRDNCELPGLVSALRGRNDVCEV